MTEPKETKDETRRESRSADRTPVQWHAVFESITEGVVLSDAHGNLLSMNPAALAIHEFVSLADMRTRLSEYPELFELHDLAGRFLPLEEWPLSRVLRGERFVGYDVRVRRCDTGRSWIGSYGGTPVFDASGRLELAVLTLRDVTERERATAAIAEREARFRQLADTMPQLAWIARGDGHISWYNRRWYEYTGTTPQQMEGWGWQAVHDPDVLPEVLERWRSSIATGAVFEMELPLRAADGTFRPFLTRVAPLRDDAGQVVQWFGTNTDVTEQRRAAEEREQLLEREREARSVAENASRMKDEFLATLSHELRTPLNAILGWAHLLGQGQRSAEELARGMRTIERNARAQTQIVEDLLDMSGIVGGKVRLEVQRVDLAALISSSIQAVAVSAEAKGVRIDTVLHSRAAPITGDPARLQQVLWNLLSNAVKFTPRGGRIEVRLERVGADAKLTVADTGEGIEPAFLPFVFDRFRQGDASTTRRHGGLGIGLAIVKQLVELHGGKVHARSAGPDQGSSFTISLPGAGSEHSSQPEISPQPVDASDAADAPLDVSGVKVLVVDDEPDTRAVIQRLLEGYGAEVRTAGSAAEALALLESEVPTVLVSDIGMPGEDGYALIRRIRAMPAPKGRIPALALTAYARPEDRVKAVIAGFQMHVAKPVEPAELVALVASLAQR
jgi:PAS domain S-box-containing protein